MQIMDAKILRIRVAEQLVASQGGFCPRQLIYQLISVQRDLQ
jgi:hypothetical protein